MTCGGKSTHFLAPRTTAFHADVALGSCCASSSQLKACLAGPGLCHATMWDKCMTGACTLPNHQLSDEDVQQLWPLFAQPLLLPNQVAQQASLLHMEARQYSLPHLPHDFQACNVTSQSAHGAALHAPPKPNLPCAGR